MYSSKRPISCHGGQRNSTGSDIIKATGLDAKAVLIERPTPYGLAVFLERGVKEVLKIGCRYRGNIRTLRHTSCKRFGCIYLL